MPINSLTSDKIKKKQIAQSKLAVNKLNENNQIAFNQQEKLIENLNSGESVNKIKEILAKYSKIDEKDEIQNLLDSLLKELKRNKKISAEKYSSYKKVLAEINKHFESKIDRKYFGILKIFRNKQAVSLLLMFILAVILKVSFSSNKQF